MKPFFSIVIPTLNEEKFLPGLLEDLQKQKERDFEVIVVDSLSKDKTDLVVSQYKKLLPINFIQKKGNISQGRNIGADLSKGEYLVFLDADAGINTSFIGNLKKSIFNKRCLLIIPNIVPDIKEIDTDLVFKFVNMIVELSQNLNKPFSTGGSIIIEKNLFSRIGGFNDKLFLSEDHDLIQKAQKWGVKAKFIRNLNLKFSLRRIRREGRMSLYYKYLVATSYNIIKGDLKDKIFNYQTGGLLYSKKNNKILPEDNIRKNLKKIKNFFNNYFPNEKI
ncbi:glycosyltransferase [Candidatus Roizmanbacteria bacterium]|nr:glycosyltransferase [Candidatus Roizmanbacteria bacterium]